MKLKNVSLYPEMNGVFNSTFSSSYNGTNPLIPVSLTPFFKLFSHFNYDD